jgi:hypothetical protein
MAAAEAPPITKDGTHERGPPAVSAAPCMPTISPPATGPCAVMPRMDPTMAGEIATPAAPMARPTQRPSRGGGLSRFGRVIAVRTAGVFSTPLILKCSQCPITSYGACCAPAASPGQGPRDPSVSTCLKSESDLSSESPVSSSSVSGVAGYCTISRGGARPPRHRCCHGRGGRPPALPADGH